MVKLNTAWVWPATDPLRTRRLRHPHRQTTFSPPHAGPRTTRRRDLSDLLGRPFGLEDTTNERPKKDKPLSFLTLFRKIPTPSNSRDASITRGLSRMTTNLDILSTRPLRTLETKGATYRHKALGKTGRTSKPYAPIATVFLFTRKIMLNVSRVSSFDVCLPKEGIGGVRLQNLPQRRSCQVAQVNRTSSDCHRDTKTKNSNSYAGFSNLVTNVRARTHLVGAFPPLIPPR